ncbi:hypothetical protein LSAT2_027336 [Lamellibrachia satsuma]|nr:hypothetical protein LSAT2_027336 [Lamellibrachia satsuma]
MCTSHVTFDHVVSRDFERVVAGLVTVSPRLLRVGESPWLWQRLRASSRPRGACPAESRPGRLSLVRPGVSDDDSGEKDEDVAVFLFTVTVAPHEGFCK